MILDLETLRKFVNVTVQVCNLQNEEVHGLMEMVALFEHCNRNHLCMSNLLEHIKAEEAKLPPSVDFNWPGARVLRFSSSRDAFYSPDEIFLDEDTCEHVLLETIRFLREAQGLRKYDPRTPKEKFFKPQPQLMKELREKWVEKRQRLERILAYRAALKPPERPMDKRIKTFLNELKEDAL